jgi:hypothetical protein
VLPRNFGHALDEVDATKMSATNIVQKQKDEKNLWTNSNMFLPLKTLALEVCVYVPPLLDIILNCVICDEKHMSEN